MLAIFYAIVLVVLCLALRLPWSTRIGYFGDMRWFHGWATGGMQLRGELVDGEPAGLAGIGRLYNVRKDCNYPPLYMEVLSYLPSLHAWWYGKPDWERVRITSSRRYRRQGSSSGRRARRPQWSIARVLKLPAIVACIAITLLTFAWAWKLAPPVRAVFVAACWALNPLAIYNSAYFGQVDAIHSLGMLAALLAAIERRIVLAWTMVTLALLTKPQAITIVPIVALETLRPLVSALRAADRAALRSVMRTWLAAAIASAAVAWMILWPFVHAGTLGKVRDVYTGSISSTRNARTTVTAKNLWWLLAKLPGPHSKVPRDDKAVGGLITPRQIGFVGFAVIIAAALLLAARGDSRQTTILAAVVIGFAFFLVSTQMKARYCFPVVVLLLPLIAIRLRYVVPFAILTLTFLLNGLRILPFAPELFPFASTLSALARWPSIGYGIAITNLMVFAYLFVDLYRCSARSSRALAVARAVQSQRGA